MPDLSWMLGQSKTLWRLKLWKSWRHLAKRLNLSIEGNPLFRNPRLSGRIERSEVSVEIQDERPIIRIWPVPPIPTWLLLISERLQLDPLTFAGLLEASIASVLRELRGKGAVLVRDGQIQCELFSVLGDVIAETLHALKTLILTLNLEELDIPERLRRNVRQDRSRDVRHDSLALLLKHYLDRDEARAAIDDGCLDADPEIRLVAALQKGEQAEVLCAVAETTTAAPHVRATALRNLVERIPIGQSAPVLERCLQKRVDLEVLHAAIEGVGALGYKPAAELLVALLDRVFDLETEKKITWALSRIGGKLAEAGLLRLLRRAENETDLPRSVLEALGEIGTAQAVQTLLPYAEGVLIDRGLKHTARAAIRRIQSRLGNAESGQLSLAETHGAGALSLTEQPGGLSLAPPAQRESPPEECI